MVAPNAPVCVPDGTPMVTEGLSTSTVTVCDVAAVFWLFAASVATSAATPIGHSPTCRRSYRRCVDGVITIRTPRRDACRTTRSEILPNPQSSIRLP